MLQISFGNIVIKSLEQDAKGNGRPFLISDQDLRFR